jgi:hypothetical protein
MFDQLMQKLYAVGGDKIAQAIKRQIAQESGDIFVIQRAKQNLIRGYFVVIVVRLLEGKEVEEEDRKGEIWRLAQRAAEVLGTAQAERHSTDVTPS